MRFSTVYAAALASTAAAPAVFAMPFASEPGYKAGVAESLAARDVLADSELVAREDILPQLIARDILAGLQARADGADVDDGESESGALAAEVVRRLYDGASELYRRGPGSGSRPGSSSSHHSSGSRKSVSPTPDSVNIQFANTIMAKKKNQHKQDPLLNDVGTFVQQPAHASTLKGHKTSDVVIHDGYHTSQSMGGQSHSSFAAYNRHGNLVQGGHVSAADARHGELYTPADQKYRDKWDPISKANPGAGGQKSKNVKW